MMDGTLELQPEHSEATPEQLENRMSADCPYDPENLAEESDEYCDGPGARTRSKMGQEQNLSNKLTSPSFLVQIPFYSLKKEKNRKCSVCGKHGRTPSDLLRHMRVHTGERPFPCIGCDKKFKCKRSQLTHQYLTHSITDGLSSHRLQILELKKMRRPSKGTFPNVHFEHTSLISNDIVSQKVVQDLPEVDVRQEELSDQDEDTEIVAGDDVPSMNGEVMTSFEGVFKSKDSSDHQELNMQSLVDELSSNDLQNSKDEGEVDGDDGQLVNDPEISESKDNNVQDSLPTEQLRVPILRIKTHKCTHCKRQFRSIYTLRYHLRSMHDEKVYLSPALESRLKKRRWLPPHVRLQKPKINLSLGLLLKNRLSNKEKVNTDNNTRKMDAHIAEVKQNIPTLSTFPEEATNSIVNEQKQDIQISSSNNKFECETNEVSMAVVKTEKVDPNSNVTENFTSTDVNNNSNSTLRNILTSKESLFNQLHQYTSTFSSQIPGADNSSQGKSVSSSYIVPPHIFLPSNSQLDEGLENNKPVSWESLHVTSENVLVTKMEAIHPTTQQKYVLYKCSQCGKAFSGLRAISVHLASHNDNTGNDCEKCGASFKWQNELDTHMDCHRADRKFIPSSQFLPSYYVNPFTIPVLPTGEQAVMPTTGLLSYPFFPMPQQISPLVQPGFFPFFTTAVQPSSQVQHTEGGQSGPTTNKPSCPSSSDPIKDSNNEDNKNLQQNCSFQCKMCPKTFDRIFSLQRHERIHSGVKACFCKTCGRGFSELRNLRHHIVRFHADTAKMEPLPYRRQPTRVRSSSQRLVSFLKKTAVRILNSIGQSKLEPPVSSMKMQMTNSDQDTLQQHSDYPQDHHHQQQQNSDELPQNLTFNHQSRNNNSISENQATVKTFQTEFGNDKTPSGQEPKNMLNYMKVPELEDLPKLNGSSILNDTAKSIIQSKSNNNSTSNRPLEVLQDPKRSLLGNRRKGRPFKLTTTNTCNFLNPIADENLFAITQKILNGMPKLNIEASPNFITSPANIGTNMVSNELTMPQLQFFHTDISNNEPLDMTSVKEIPKPPPDIKPEVERNNNTDLATTTDNISTNYSSVLPISDSSLTSGQLLQNQTLDGKCLFPCSYCHRSFNTLSDLNRHMTFHADIRPFKCPYCSYCSRTNSQLKVHMMRHEGIKHYMCQICNYNGVTQSDLNRHLKTRTHLLRSRNICACCGTGFHTRSLSEEHYKSCRLMGGTQDSAKTTKDSRLHLENKNRGNRLKHVQKPIEDSLANIAVSAPKKEFFKNLLELGKMGVPFADFLHQANVINTVK